MAAFDNNPLSRWLGEQRLWLKPGQQPKRPGVAVRFLFPPGNASVPYDKYHMFLLFYADYVLKEEGLPRLAVAEAHGPAFKLFMDVDLKLPDPQVVLERSALERLLQAISAAVARGTGKATEMIVCMADPYDLGGGMHKVGLHLHWPDLVVGAQEARELCRGCVPACQAEFPGLTDWANVFDGSVYANGACLRLIGCIKGDPKTEP